MTEPHASEFRRLVRLGAGARDIHGAPDLGFARVTRASDAFLEREVGRVETHLRSSCAVLESFVGRAARVLDVGCSTGGGTVAMALSPVLAPDVVIGVDPDRLSLSAAEARARGHGLGRRSVAFVACEPEAPLPFDAHAFDLVVCVSVLEFLPSRAARERLVQEMKRVTRPGGHVFLSTPNPLRLRETHSRRWFGDLIRRRGHPWASAPWDVRSMLADWERIPVGRLVLARALRASEARVPTWLGEAAALVHPWQKLLARKPA